MLKHLIIATTALVAYSTATPALARTGKGVTVANEPNIAVSQRNAFLELAIGQDSRSHDVTAAIAGDVVIGRDVIDKVTARTLPIAIGQRPSVTVGTIVDASDDAAKPGPTVVAMGVVVAAKIGRPRCVTDEGVITSKPAW